MNNPLLYDVLAVNLKTSRVRIMAAAKSYENAEAFVEMAVYRRGCDGEFYCTSPVGKYKEGDIYHE